MRPAVMIRKTWGGNATWIGAGTQERLMSVCRTARQQGVDVIEALTELQRQPEPGFAAGPDHPGAQPGSGRMSTRRRRPRAAAAADDQGRPSKPASIRCRIVIHEISDADERLLVDYTVDGYVAAIGRRLPIRDRAAQYAARRPDGLTIGLAGLNPDAMAEFVDKHPRGR